MPAFQAAAKVACASSSETGRNRFPSGAAPKPMAVNLIVAPDGALKVRLRIQKPGGYPTAGGQGDVAENIVRFHASFHANMLELANNMLNSFRPGNARNLGHGYSPRRR